MRITVDNAELLLEVMGEGLPIVAIHGGLGLDHSYFRPYLDSLGVDHRILLPDLRGHGQSSGRETLASATHATFVDDLRKLHESLGVDRWVVLGHSYGGFLGLEYALAYPDDLAALILCATSASLAHAPKALEAASRESAPELTAAMIRAFSTPAADDEDFARSWRLIAPLYFADPRLIERAFDKVEFSAAGFNRGNFCLSSYDLRKRLSEIQVPTLVLSGARDWLMPPHFAGDELAAAIPGARHHVFDESGHFPFIEESGDFIAVVRDWLRSLAQEAA